MIGRHPFSPFRNRREPPAPTEVDLARNRLLIAAGLTAAAFTLVAFRLLDVIIMPATQSQKVERSIPITKHYVSRADILDRNGRIMATNLNTASLYANPNLIQNKAGVAAKLAAILNLNAASLAEQFESKRPFLWIKRHLTPKQTYAVNKLGIPGLDFANEQRRVYPLGSLASHVLGFTNIDNHGLKGIENKFNNTLSNSGKPLRLSIDVRVQNIMREALLNSINKFHAIGGAGLVLDARNGEILSMVSLPDFNPNLPRKAKNKVLFNRATHGVYEMGSTLKIFNTAMALEHEKITMQSGYDATKPIRTSKFVIKDYHAKNRWLSIPEIFMYSSNIGSVKMAMDVGRVAQRKFFKRLGLLNKPQIELGEVGKPIVPEPWNDIHSMTISYGHGLAISPLQLVAGVAAVVNGGVLYTPTLFQRTQLTIGSRVISKETSEQVRRLLKLVVSHGTGSLAAAKGYLVGGKTGTAEKVVGREYKREALLSSFIAAFPINAPKYVVFVMIDNPVAIKGTRHRPTGGWVAAPVVGEVISRIGPLLGVKPINQNDPSVRDQMTIRVLTMKSGEKRLVSF